MKYLLCAGPQQGAPGQLSLGPHVSHHLGHTISPLGPPSSGNQLPGLLGALGQGLGFGSGLGTNLGTGLGTMIQPTMASDHSNSNPTGSSSYSGASSSGSGGGSPPQALSSPLSLTPPGMPHSHCQHSCHNDPQCQVHLPLMDPSSSVPEDPTLVVKADPSS